MKSGNSNRIHRTAVIGENVTLGIGNYIGPFCVISDGVVLGNYNWIGAGSQIGAIPEHRKVDHFSAQALNDLKGTQLGNGNIIREGVQIHQGLLRPTIIQDDCFIMNQTYIAHDCFLGNSVTLASSVLLAGTVTVGSLVNLGMGSKVHQGISIGELVMAGMGSVITSDLPSFTKVYGVPAKIRGLNKVGLERSGFSEELIRELTKIIEPSKDISIMKSEIELLMLETKS